jgi:hypothetical protein
MSRIKQVGTKDKATVEVVEKVRALLNANAELVKQRAWPELAKLANQAEIKSSRGKEWETEGPQKGTTFYIFCKRQHLLPDTSSAKAEQGRAISTAIEGDAAEINRPAAKTSDTSDVSKTKRARPDTSREKPMPKAWHQQIVVLVKSEVERLMKVPTLQTLPTIPLPPERARTKGAKGRPVGQGERVKVGITLDKNLFDRFEQERKRTGLSASGYADVVLWNFFGKPRLSFEETEDRQPEHEEN